MATDVSERIRRMAGAMKRAGAHRGNPVNPSDWPVKLAFALTHTLGDPWVWPCDFPSVIGGSVLEKCPESSAADEARDRAEAAGEFGREFVALVEDCGGRYGLRAEDERQFRMAYRAAVHLA